MKLHLSKQNPLRLKSSETVCYLLYPFTTSWIYSSSQHCIAVIKNKTKPYYFQPYQQDLTSLEAGSKECSFPDLLLE